MKKIVFILSFIFVATLGATTYAVVSHSANGNETTLVNNNPEQKPCPKDCTCDKCTAKAEASSESAKAEAKPACCTKTKKAECTKSKECTKEKKAAETQPAKTE